MYKHTQARDVELEDFNMIPLPDDIKRMIIPLLIFTNYEYFAIVYDWNRLDIDYDLSETFIERHMDKLDMESICENYILSESFIEKHMDVFNMENVYI